MSKNIKAQESVGQKFGKLLVVGLVNFNRHGQRRVRCICDCGKEKIATLNRLKMGETQSCGCLRIDNANKQLKKAVKYNPNIKAKLEPRLATAKIIYRSRYSDGNLTFDDFLRLSQQNCYYCESPPSNTTNYYITKDNRYSKERQLMGYFTYSGLDRIDSNLSHDIDNVVPSCIHCNKAKLNYSREDFFAWIEKVYNLHLYR